MGVGKGAGDEESVALAGLAVSDGVGDGVWLRHVVAINWCVQERYDILLAALLKRRQASSGGVADYDGAVMVGSISA